MENKKIIIGGLAIVGAIALFAYLKPKPKKNSEGFFNAQGRRGGCAQCESGGYYYGARKGSCGGGRCIANYA
jgi:hypothetical protein